ncbi:hypothetical protein [Ureibacillus acetophenoni]
MIAVVSPIATTNPEKPRHVVDPEKTAEILAKYIEMDEANIYKNLTKKITDSNTGELKQPYQVEFDQQVGIVHEIKTSNGNYQVFYLQAITKRYPNGPFASRFNRICFKRKTR